MAEPAKEPARADRAAKARGVCVNCGRPRDPHYDPFCSRRCADVDLHRWLKGGYVIPGGEPASRENDDEP
ncbi:MAG: DNA gyrase inhibitor YacG [Roseiarcus sp.]|jgi:endogenous inhibitor of DNA gyrase (YacG/DUF329 family)